MFLLTPGHLFITLETVRPNSTPGWPYLMNGEESSSLDPVIAAVFNCCSGMLHQSPQTESLCGPGSITRLWKRVRRIHLIAFYFDESIFKCSGHNWRMRSLAVVYSQTYLEFHQFMHSLPCHEILDQRAMLIFATANQVYYEDRLFFGTQKWPCFRGY